MSTDYDIVCLTETHLDETIDSSTIIETPDRDVFCRDRTLRGGGVLICTKTSLQAKLLTIDTNKEEMVIVKLPPNLIICCYYRPNISCPNIDEIDRVLDIIIKQEPNSDILLVGDLNLPHIDWNRHKTKPSTPYQHLHQCFLDVLSTHDMTQIITQPTHIHGSTLDIICTTNTGLIHSTDIISPGLSDHSVITAELLVKNVQAITKNKKTKPKLIRIYREADIEVFEKHMNTTETCLSTMTDVDLMWNTFSSDFRKAIEESVPTKEIYPHPDGQPPWFNRQILKLIKKQHRTYKQYKTEGDPYLLAKYKKQRRENSKTIKMLKKRFITKKICGPLAKGNSKPFYKYLRTKKKEEHPIMKLRCPDGTNITDSLSCAEALNSYFQQQFCDGKSASELSPLIHTESPIKITEEGIEKLIHDLKNNKSPGADSIRKCELLVHPSLTSRCLKHIFQLSIDTGKLPLPWKSAIVTPIHKKGPKDEPSNYRPISLTSIPCKMLEHIVLHYLNKKLDSILHNRQHGFRKGLSCETQLCATYHDLVKAAEDSSTTHAVILDFKKAFDKVPHRLLLEKLRNIEDIHPCIVNWIHDFLLRRTQRVAIKGTLSDELPVTSGVPQGSVLGPTLFLVYINDLPACVSCNVSLYADDTLLYSVVNSIQDRNQFQSNINALYDWSVRNMMPFNTTKCEVIVFNNKNMQPPTYTLGGHTLNCVQETKYLGVLIQSDLKFSHHITSKINTANRVLGSIKYTLHDAPTPAKLLAYLSLCRPVLEYSDVLWDPADKASCQKLELVQNKAIRFIKSIKGRSGVTAGRCSLGLQTLEQRRKNHRLSLLMKILSAEESHKTLSSAYDEITNCRRNTTMTTRAAEKGQPTSIYASTTAYHNSFLPRSIRDLKL